MKNTKTANDINKLYQLSNLPKDTISSLKFSNTSIENNLLVTSWDKNAYLHKINFDQSSEIDISDTLIFSQLFPHPQLDACFDPVTPNCFYTVGLDSEIKQINIELNSTISIGSHDAPINKILTNPVLNNIITAGWDKEIKIWDTKQATTSNDNHKKGYKSLIQSFNPNFNITGMTISGNKLVICGSTDFSEDSGYNLNKHLIKVYDVRNLSEIEKTYESTLRNETRSICDINNGEGFVIGSAEGRIAVEYFKELEEINRLNSNIIRQSYAFKCHREDKETKSVIHAVNALVYHPSLNLFVSGGTDGKFLVWDNIKRKKIYKSLKFPQTITNLAFNSDGRYLAIGASNIYESLEFPEEEQTLSQNFNSPKIFIQSVSSFL